MITANLKYTETVTMITEICCNCGVAFGIPSDLQRVLRADPNKYFYCPNGHSQHYSKSTADKLREQIESEKNDHKRQMEQLQNKFLDEMNNRLKLEKQLKRIHKGVCPCCNRSFQNLKQHIETKHPELATKIVVAPIHKSINERGKKK